MKYQYQLILFILLLLSLAFPSLVFANATINPTVTTTSSKAVFIVTVYADKDISTETIKILIPSGISKVIPFVKQGWTINTITTGDKVTEIDWTDGNIPSGQQDTFTFSAQVPTKPTTLIWKISQTYADGTITTWDQNPKKVITNPAAVTLVTTPQKSVLQTEEESTTQKTNVGFVMSIVGIVLASAALSIARRKNPRMMLTEKPPRQRKVKKS